MRPPELARRYSDYFSGDCVIEYQDPKGWKFTPAIALDADARNGCVIEAEEIEPEADKMYKICNARPYTLPTALTPILG